MIANFVADERSHCIEHGRRDEILARYELEPVCLTTYLSLEYLRDLRIGCAQRRARCRIAAVPRTVLSSAHRASDSSARSIFSTRLA